MRKTELICSVNRVAILLLLSTVILLFSLEAVAKRRKDSKEDKRWVESVVMGGEYEIKVARAVSMKGAAVALSGGYSVEVRGDSVECYLPYYGVAYSVNYGGGEGLIFTGAVHNYLVEKGRRGAYEVSFEAQSSEDIYSFNISIASDGGSSITIHPTKKQMMTFYGQLLTIKMNDE